MDKGREEALREIFREIYGNKDEVRGIMMDPPGSGEEYTEFFTIQIKYSRDEDFVQGKASKIKDTINKRIFGINPDIAFFEDADDEGILSFGLIYKE